MLNFKFSYLFYLTERTCHTVYTSIKVWQELEKTTRSSASLQLLEASTFIAECGHNILDSACSACMHVYTVNCATPSSACACLHTCAPRWTSGNWVVGCGRRTGATVASTYKRIVRGSLHCKGQYQLLSRLRCLHNILIRSNLIHSNRPRARYICFLFSTERPVLIIILIVRIIRASTVVYISR